MRLVLLALLPAACSRSALQSPANRAAPSGTAGTPASGEQPGASGSNAPRDAGPRRDPPRRDGGLPPASDAGVRPAADAGPRDAGAPDASAAEPPADPPPLRAPGDLVFIKQDNAASSLWAMRLSDFSVRRLDPPAALRPVSGMPLSYSPDGRKLLIIESDAYETRYRVAYRCREAACAGLDQPSRVVLRGPADDVSTETYRASPHAADSSGMLLQTRRGAFYLRFAPGGAEDALQLSHTPYPEAYFVGGARGVLLANQNAAGVTFVDLAAEPLSPQRLRASDGTDVLYLSSVSPDGQHWLTSFPLHAFSASDVLAGELRGALVATGTYPEHAGDQWFLMRGETRFTLRSWDGSKQSELAGSESFEAHACDNRIVFVASDKGALSSLDLSASASGDPPQPLPLAGVPLGAPRFVARCSKAVVRNGTRHALIDLADGSSLEREHLADYDFNDRATLMGGSRGVYTTFRVDTLANATPLAFRPRRPLDASPIAFAHDGLFFVAAGPLLDMMQPRLYRVDFSDASQTAPEVEALSDRPTDINNLILTADDRYLAYGVRLPLLPVDPATAGEGVYERDLRTGETELVSAPFERGLNGRLRVQRIPEHRALLVMGNYPNAPRESIYVVNLDSGELVHQIPDEAEPRVPLDTWFTDDYAVSDDGEVLWYRAVGAKPSRFAQRLRFANAEPLAPAQVLAYEPQSHAYAHAQMDSMYDYAFLGAIGPLFHARSGPGSSRAEVQTLSYFDLQSGTARVLARGEGVSGAVVAAAFARRSGRVALQRWDDQGNGRFSLVNAGALEHEETVFAGPNLSGARFSPDERWFAFSEGPSAGYGTIHLYDVEAGEDHALPHTLSGSRLEVVAFDPAAARVLVLSDLAKLYAQDLASGAEPQLVAEGVSYSLQISADARLAAWSSDQGTFLSKLDGSLQPRRIAAGANSNVVLSPSGRRLLVREPDESTGWRLIRTDTLDADPVPLVGSIQHNIELDPSERYAVGYHDESGASFMTVWKLDDPSTPHPVLSDGETGWSFWVEGTPL